MKAKDAVMKAKGYDYPVPLQDKMNMQKSEILKLDYNEPTIQPSPAVKEALCRYINFGELQWYPEGDCRTLREELAAYTGQPASRMIAGNGSDELLKTIAGTYLSEGDEAIVLRPNYSMFVIDAELLGAKVVDARDAKDARRKITGRTKAVYLSNPNTPTGMPVSKDDIVSLLDTGVLVVVDEAYYEFYGSTSAGLIDSYDNLIVVRTFSKAFSLAGLRLGYALSREENIRQMMKVKDPESVNALAQIAGITALNDLSYMRSFVEDIKVSRRFVAEELGRLGLEVLESRANFLMLPMDDPMPLYRRLQRLGVFTRLRKDIPGIRVGVPDRAKADVLLQRMRKSLNPLLVFDIDGVLIDAKAYDEAIKRTVEQLSGKPAYDEDLQNLRSKGGFNNDWDTAEELLSQRGKKVSRDLLVDIFRQAYEQVKDRDELLADRRMLEELSIDYELAIFTGRPRDEADYVLARFGIRDLFSGMICMEDCKKPDPTGLIELMAGGEAFYFGDMVDDIQAGKSAGAKVVSVGLDIAGADFNIESIDDIREVL